VTPIEFDKVGDRCRAICEVAWLSWCQSR